MPVPLPIISLVPAKGHPSCCATKLKSSVSPAELGTQPSFHPVCCQLGVLCVFELKISL